eukprot:jgi/Picsp_1/1066/NSC_04549-R1_pentatricopeptide repeat-containing protein mitochondrial-like
MSLAHAFVLSSVSGIKPLPQTYACVLLAFLKEGDLDTAIAIYASNRRSGLSAEASWRPLCTYLLNTGDFDQAMHFIEQDNCMDTALIFPIADLSVAQPQGESDGLKPDPRMLYAIIRALCQTGDLKGSVKRLKELCDSGHQPDKNILSTVVTAYAKSGKLKEAETLLLTLIEAPGATSASTIGSINAMLQMYMNAGFSKEELAKRISKLRQVMLRGGMTLDRKGYSLLLEASVHLEDPTVGWLAFQSLQTQPMGSLQYLTLQVLCDFLFDLRQVISSRVVDILKKLCSSFGEASKIDTVLAAMATERRKFDNFVMRTDANEKTFISRWLENAEQTEKNQSNMFTIDGVALDSSTLCVLSESGEISAPTKMSVRELRAELAARQCPLRGNKKELIKQLQKARAEAEIEGAGPISTQTTKSKKVDIMIAEEAWNEGELEAQNTYEDEREVEQEEDDESQQVDEFGEDSEKHAKEEDEEDSFDYEDRIFAVMKAKVQKLDIHENLTFNHEEPGILEAIMILRRVITMGGIPTNQDILFLLNCLPDNGNLAQEILTLVQETSLSLTEETLAKVNALICEKDIAES